MLICGNALRVKPKASGGLTVDTDGLWVNTDGTTTCLSSGNIALVAGGVDTTQIATDAVGDGQIDWATAKAAPTGNQIGASSIPVSDGWGGTATDVDAALEELRTSVGSVDSFKTISDGTNTAVAADYDTLTIEPASGSPITVTVSDVTGDAKIELDISVDDSTIEVSGGNLQVKADAINDTHIDWGTGANQINAATIPTGAAWEGTATDVDTALEELRDTVTGSYLALSGGTMSGDIDMGGNDITNIGNASLEFVNGSKIIAANFDSSGNIILADEVDDTTIEWVSGVSVDWDGFDDGSADTAISSTAWVGSADPVYEWRVPAGYSSLVYKSDYAEGASTYGAGFKAIDATINRKLTSAITPFSSGTYSFSTEFFMENNSTESLSAYINFLGASGSQSAGFKIYFITSGTNVNLYVDKWLEGKKADWGLIASVASVGTIASFNSGVTLDISFNYTTKTINIDIDSVNKVNQTWTTANETLGSIELCISGYYSGKFGTTTYGAGWDTIVEPNYTPTSGSSYLQIKDGAVTTDLIAADAINDTHIDWGTSTNQVAADDIPIVDSSSVFTQTTVENVLKELYDKTIEYISSGEALAAGDIVAVNSSGRVVKAIGVTTGLYEPVGISLTVTSGAEEVVTIQYDRIIYVVGLLTGIGNAGDVIFLSSTSAGDLIATEPTASDTVVKRVGIKVDDNRLFISWGATILN